jgi:hypothetical protein
MAQPGLIADYLSQLAARLPGPIVDELADGLHETYLAHRRAGRTPDEAAQHAVAEFGAPATITAAFLAASPARRAARALLLTGPLVGGAWATALLTLHAWDWPVPAWARAGFAAVLLTGVAMVAVAAFGQCYRRAARNAAAASLAVLALDVAVISYVDAAGLLTTWPVLLAAPLSLGRCMFTLGRLPQVFGSCFAGR